LLKNLATIGVKANVEVVLSSVEAGVSLIGLKAVVPLNNVKLVAAEEEAAKAREVILISSPELVASNVQAPNKTSWVPAIIVPEAGKVSLVTDK
jgi:hypothetical protein